MIENGNFGSRQLFEQGPTQTKGEVSLQSMMPQGHKIEMSSVYGTINEEFKMNATLEIPNMAKAERILIDMFNKEDMSIEDFKTKYQDFIYLSYKDVKHLKETIFVYEIIWDDLTSISPKILSINELNSKKINLVDNLLLVDNFYEDGLIKENNKFLTKDQYVIVDMNDKDLIERNENNRKNYSSSILHSATADLNMLLIPFNVKNSNGIMYTKESIPEKFHKNTITLLNNVPSTSAYSIKEMIGNIHITIMNNSSKFYAAGVYANITFFSDFKFLIPYIQNGLFEISSSSEGFVNNRIAKDVNLFAAYLNISGSTFKDEDRNLNVKKGFGTPEVLEYFKDELSKASKIPASYLGKKDKSVKEEPKEVNVFDKIKNLIDKIND